MRFPPFTFGLAVASIGIVSCSPDVFDVDVDLAPHSYQADFGASSGTIPTVACDPAMPGACVTDQSFAASSTVGVPADVTVTVGCDPAIARCYAAAHARLAYELDVLQDDDFVTKVERRAISVVRGIDLAYTMPVNTLTFDVPRIDVYVGPSGTKTEADPGVALVDSISSIGAGTTFVAERRHLTLTDHTQARAQIESNIQAKEPFVFVIVTTPRLEAGAPVPGGALEIDIYPKVELGLD
jgi:hypothetical protein